MSRTPRAGSARRRPRPPCGCRGPGRATGQLRALRVWGIPADGADVTGWLETGYAAGVRDLALHYGELTDDDLERLAKSPAAARLIRLSLGGRNRFTGRGLRAL